MKKQILLPALVVLLAVGGAFASGRFTTVYFAGNDDTCQNPILPPDECTPGEDVPCIDPNSNLQYHYKIDANDTECRDLLKSE
ncbi:MAG: DUF6520 family protein [Bacteroidota bacterium]